MESAVFALLATAGAKSSPTDTTALILQGVAGVLSIPFLTAALTALFRFMSPTQRISARLRSDLAIYRDLPPSAGKDVLGERINENLLLLNARYAPKAVTVISGVADEEQATAKPIAQPVRPYRIKNPVLRWTLAILLILGTLIVVLIVVVAVIIFFHVPNVINQFNYVPVLIGAGLSLLWYLRSYIARPFRRKPKVPPITK
jgi:hypothetical protein